MGKGGFTPKTLEDNLDHMRKLTSQLAARHRYRVAYNSVGDYLYAAVIPSDIICSVGTVAVGTETLDAAHFLSGLLNARCLHDAFVSAQKTDRNFHLHVLTRRPLPRFNVEDDTHMTIVGISKKCEALARNTYRTNPDLGTFAIRTKIRNTLYESGLERQLYNYIRIILPNYVIWDP